MRTLVGLLILAIASPALAKGDVGDLEFADGRRIMDAVYERHHQYPYVYEEQSMILIDRHDNRETRKLRRYSRVNETGVVDFLLLFDSPKEVTGVAVRATKTAGGEVRESVYLPAFGRTLVQRRDASAAADASGVDESFLGTDYSVENIAGEVLNDYLYERRVDSVQEDLEYFVIDVFARSTEDTTRTFPLRRHFVRKDNLFITQTDHFNNLGRMKKRMTHHDLVAVLGDMWRSNMMLMENFAEEHKSIIKIDRRIFSADYVPDEVFTEEWLYSNSPPIIREEEPTTKAEVAMEIEEAEPS